MNESTSKHAAEHQSNESLIAEAMAADFFYSSGFFVLGNGRHL